MELLYYAGMAADQATEQIGLAIREEGRGFERVGDRGLILPRDPGVWWRSARTCNPMVLRDRRGRYVMYYHGAQATETGKTITHTIGRAESRDGIAWEAPDEPVLGWRDMAAIDPEAAKGRGIGVIEPCVAEEASGWRMWFVYRSASFPGNALFEARSLDGLSFEVTPLPLVTGAQLGGRRIHYPQVVGDTLWFTLVEHPKAYAIVRAPLAAPTRPEFVLPAPGFVRPRRVVPSFLHRVPGARRLDRALCRVGTGGRDHFGHAHPHVMDDGTMYYHSYHLGPRGPWMDIGRRTPPVDSGPARRETVLAPAAHAGAWDAYFVADPFVLEG